VTSPQHRGVLSRSAPMRCRLSLSRSLLVLLVATVGCDAAGDSACPCIGSPSWQPSAVAGPGDPRLKVVVGSDTTFYPPSYGIGSCAAHSAGDGSASSGSPSCIDSTGAALSSRPAWCEDAWCYVDERDCEIAGGAIVSSLFPNAFYSYQTCSAGSTSSLGEDGVSTHATCIVASWLLICDAAGLF
jgi:hypothetical protein